jgi:hypothetical protein
MAGLVLSNMPLIHLELNFIRATSGMLGVQGHWGGRRYQGETPISGIVVSQQRPQILARSEHFIVSVGKDRVSRWENRWETLEGKSLPRSPMFFAIFWGSLAREAKSEIPLSIGWSRGFGDKLFFHGFQCHQGWRFNWHKFWFAKNFAEAALFTVDQASLRTSPHQKNEQFLNSVHCSLFWFRTTRIRNNISSGSRACDYWQEQLRSKRRPVSTNLRENFFEWTTHFNLPEKRKAGRPVSQEWSSTSKGGWITHFMHCESKTNANN